MGRGAADGTWYPNNKLGGGQTGSWGGCGHTASTPDSGNSLAVPRASLCTRACAAQPWFCSLPGQSLLALSRCHGAGLVTDFTPAGDVRMSELQELGLRLGELGWLVPSQGCWSSGLSHEAAFSNCPPIYYLQHAKSQGYYTSLVFLGSNSTRLRAGTSSLPSCAARSRLIAFSN